MTAPTLQRARQSYYQRAIQRILDQRGIKNIDPRHVEGWMRVEHSTLDHLDAERFAAEVDFSIACIAASGVRTSEQNARSFGL